MTDPTIGTSRTRRLLAALMLLLAPLAVVFVWAAAGSDLPDTLATHWGFGSRPDGFTTATPFLSVSTAVVAIIAVFGAAVILRAHAASPARPVALVVGLIDWVLAASTIAVLVANRGLADPHEARSGWVATVVVLVAAAALALATARVAPATVGLTPRRSPESDLRLAPGERVAWVGSASSRGLLVVAGVLGVVGAVLVAFLQPWGFLVLLLAVPVAWTHSLTVRVDESGVRAHFGPWAWPASVTPLDRIEAVEATEIVPLQWGGWGWRISRRGTAFVVRRGPGLVLGRRGRSDLAMTVDRADEAAELVNALLARESRGAAPQ